MDNESASNATYVTRVNLRDLYKELLALIDGGANGCIGGTDLTLLWYHMYHKRVNVGVANGHQMTNLRLAVMAAYIETTEGPKCGIFNNIAADAKIKQSILSCTQMRAAGNFISDVPKGLGGLQLMQTNSGHKIPFKICSGLAYMEMRPITLEELKDPNIPHVMMTPQEDWNLRIFDDNVSMQDLMRQIPPTPIETTDAFYKPNGDINLNVLERCDIIERKFKKLPRSVLLNATTGTSYDNLDKTSNDRRTIINNIARYKEGSDSTTTSDSKKIPSKILFFQETPSLGDSVKDILNECTIKQ